VKFAALAVGRAVQRPAAVSDFSTSIPSIRKGTIVKRIFRLPVLAGGIVMAAFLASLAATANSRVDAQVTVYRSQNGGYYNPYGQGPYGGYNRGYAAAIRANSNMFPSRGGMFGGRTYGYSRNYGYSLNRNVPRGYGNRFDYGIGPPVRIYGRSNYLQPSYGPVYVPFGYSEY
jgi:hypothetical protein